METWYAIVPPVTARGLRSIEMVSRGRYREGVFEYAVASTMENRTLTQEKQ